MPENIKIEYVYPPDYRVGTVDHMVAALTTDGTTDQVQISFSQVDVIVTSENATKMEDGRLMLIGSQTPDTKLVRRMQFKAVMRANQAVALITALRVALQSVPQEKRAQYGITNDILGQPTGAPQ